RRRTEKIPEEIATTISQLVIDIQYQQTTSLADVNARSAATEEECRFRLQ
ncbi:unnamed protein product, partial [Rotaria magnacalcarata]